MLCLTLYKFNYGIPENIRDIFKQLNDSGTKYYGYHSIKISVKEETETYLFCRMYYKVSFKDIDYSVNDNLMETFNATTNDKSNYLDFILYKNLDYICINNKSTGKYLIKFLDKFLQSQEEDNFSEVIYDLKKIFDDYKNGEYEDLWLNGIKANGHIRSVQQIGSGIDQDEEFINSDDKYGIGVKLLSSNLSGVKLAIYQKGVLNLLSKIPNSQDPIKFREKLINYFQKYV